MLPFVSIVVPTKNRRDSLEKLLATLQVQTYPSDRYETIVVDDGSDDDTGELFRNANPGKPALRYVRQNNAGPAAARNLGASLSHGEIVAFIDDDAKADPEWLSNGVSRFDSDKVGAVEGKVVAIFDGPATPLSHVVQNLNGGTFITCNMFYRRDLLLRFGGFDTRFMAKGMPYVREDSDLAFTFLEAGYKIPFASNAVVFHPVLEKSSSYLLKVEKYGYYEPLIRKKHPKIFGSPHLYGLSRRKIGFLVQPWYWGYYLSALMLVASAVELRLIWLALAILSLSHMVNIYSRCRRKEQAFHQYPILATFLFIAPYLRFYWILQGIGYAQKCFKRGRFN